MGVGDAFFGVANLLINRGIPTIVFSREGNKENKNKHANNTRQPIQTSQRRHILCRRKPRPSDRLAHPNLAIEMVQRRKSPASYLPAQITQEDIRANSTRTPSFLFPTRTASGALPIPGANRPNDTATSWSRPRPASRRCCSTIRKKCTNGSRSGLTFKIVMRRTRSSSSDSRRHFACRQSPTRGIISFKRINQDFARFLFLSKTW